MLEFKPVTKQEAPRLRRYYQTCEFGLCEYSVGTKLMWKAALHPAWAEIAGCLVVRNEIDGQVVFDYPVPGPEGDEDAALEAIENDCLERGIPPVISVVPECRAAKLLGRYPYVRVSDVRTWRDYVYYREDLQFFAGRRYSGQRNHINKFRSKWPDAQFRPLTAADKGLRTSKLQYGPARLAPKYRFDPQNELLNHVQAIPELKTERLTLSALTEADIPAYNALVLDADRNRWWGYDDVGGLGGRVEERSFFDVAKRDFENRQAVNFAVRLDGKLIGEAVLYRFDCRGGAELGCRIDKAYAGNGYGTEAFAAVAEWGLYKIHLSRVVAKCYKENQASYKMLSACMRKKGEDDTFFYFEKLV